MQKFRPFGDAYFGEHNFEFFSGGLRVDGDLIYFDSDKSKWIVVDSKGKLSQIETEKQVIVLRDDKTGKRTGEISLGAPERDLDSGKFKAIAILKPDPSPGAKSDPPVMYFESLTFDLANNPQWGLGKQKISVTNNMNMVLSTLKVEKMYRTRSLAKSERKPADNTLDLAAEAGRYESSGCGGFKKSLGGTAAQPNSSSETTH